MTNNIRVKPIGLNNRLPLTQLDVPTPRDTTPVWMAAAENIEILGGSLLRRRNGFEQALPGRWHSLWSDSKAAYGVQENGDDAGLYALARVDGTLTKRLIAVLPPLGKLHYARMPDGFVYVSDGTELSRIDGEFLTPLGLQTPNPTPVAYATTGALPAGRYQVFFTNLSAAGESCGSDAQQFLLGDNSGIAFTGLTPNTLIYATSADGEIFNEIPLGDYISLENSGGECPTFMMKPLPAGHSLRHYKGSMLVAQGPWLYISEPYRYGVYNPGRGFIPFPSNISVVVPCEDGVYVCADQTYWLPNDPLDTAPKVVLPYGALVGSATFDEDEVAAYWQTKNGVVMAKPGGEVTAVQEEAIQFRPASLGHSWVREQDGDKHLITTRFSVSP